MFNRLRPCLASAASIVLLATSAQAVTLLNTFTPGGTLNAIGYDPSSDLIYVHQNFGVDILEYDSAGNLVGTIPHPGASTNDSDLSVSFFVTTVDDVAIPVGTLMVTNGETDPQTLFAVDIGSGIELASITLAEPIGQLTGGAIDAGGRLVGMDWTSDQLIKFNPDNGLQLDNFGFGLPAWDAFYSDVEVAANGNYVLVSSSQPIVRIMSPTGQVLQDYDLSGIGVGGMSGIALDNDSTEVYISSTNGNVYHVDGIDAVPEPQTWALMGLGAAMVGWFFWRRREKIAE